MSDLANRMRAWLDRVHLLKRRLAERDRIEPSADLLHRSEEMLDETVWIIREAAARIQALEAELEESRQAAGGMLLGCIRRGEMSRSEIAALAQGKVRLPISAFNRKAVRRAYAASLVASLQPVSTSEAK